MHHALYTQQLQRGATTAADQKQRLLQSRIPSTGRCQQRQKVFAVVKVDARWQIGKADALWAREDSRRGLPVCYLFILRSAYAPV
jgi:hypothetical protein